MGLLIANVTSNSVNTRNMNFEIIKIKKKVFFPPHDDRSRKGYDRCMVRFFCSPFFMWNCPCYIASISVNLVESSIRSLSEASENEGAHMWRLICSTRIRSRICLLLRSSLQSPLSVANTSGWNSGPWVSRGTNPHECLLGLVLPLIDHVSYFVRFPSLEIEQISGFLLLQNLL